QAQKRELKWGIVREYWPLQMRYEGVKVVENLGKFSEERLVEILKDIRDTLPAVIYVEYDKEDDEYYYLHFIYTIPRKRKDEHVERVRVVLKDLVGALREAKKAIRELRCDKTARKKEKEMRKIARKAGYTSCISFRFSGVLTYLIQAIIISAVINCKAKIATIIDPIILFKNIAYMEESGIRIPFERRRDSIYV
ncbi:hypothetical protein DRO21_04190, partial [archaeon]